MVSDFRRKSVFADFIFQLFQFSIIKACNFFNFQFSIFNFYRVISIFNSQFSIIIRLVFRQIWCFAYKARVHLIIFNFSVSREFSIFAVRFKTNLQN